MGYKPITNWDDIQVLYVFQVPFLEVPWTGIPSAERHDKVLALHARCSDIPWRCTWGIWEKNRRKLEWDFFHPRNVIAKKKLRIVDYSDWMSMYVDIICTKNDSKTWYKAKKLLVSSCFQRKNDVRTPNGWSCCGWVRVISFWHSSSITYMLYHVIACYFPPCQLWS